jgi:hypothetical protein
MDKVGKKVGQDDEAEAYRQLILFRPGEMGPVDAAMERAGRAVNHAEGDRLDVSFLHKSFCIAGLPLRRPKDQTAIFSRNDGQFALTIAPNRFVLPDGAVCEVGVPWGAKGRLLMVWAATEARDPMRRAGDRWLEIGKITQWMTSIGIKVNGDNVPATKDQLVRLAFSSFTMIMKNDGQTFFKQDRLIEGGVFPEQDLDHYAAGRFNKMRWPTGVELSQKAYDRFIQHAIPVPTARLAEIANSAMAIDIFMYLCYRLPLIPSGESDLLTWRALIAQFGSGESPSKFHDTFQASIRSALAAYSEADVDLTEEGLVLRYSDPAELRRAFIAVPRSLPPQGKPAPARTRRRFAPVSEES